MHSLKEVLNSCSFYVNYSPLPDEVTPPSLPNSYIIPPRASLDPYEEAKKAVEAAAGKSVCVLVPGTQFDASGTRHGRGGGWYDRFLATVPKAWVRVGLCYEHQFSESPLVRNEWDEPVDFVYVAKGDPALIKTDARAT